MLRKNGYLMFVCVLTLLVFNFTAIYANDLGSSEKTAQQDVSVMGTALDLAGNSSYVEIGDSETLNNISEQVTVSVWIRPTDYPKRYTNILFKGNKRMPGITHRQFAFWLRPDGSVQYHFLYRR
jgi:hypothetical protein